MSSELDDTDVAKSEDRTEGSPCEETKDHELISMKFVNSIVFAMLVMLTKLR